MDNKLLDPELLKLIKYYGTIGIDLAATILGGFFIGWLMDGLFNTRPTFALLFFLIGAYAGFTSVYNLVIHKIKEEEKREAKNEEDDD